MITFAHRVRRCWVMLAMFALAAAGGCAAPPSGPVVLDVPDRADANPWVAAAGSFVAVAWGASSDGKADVLLAVSRDGGSSFGPPVQVNTVAGEARLGGEFPPRVALAPRPGSPVPEIAVLWTARTGTTEIRTARSHDGGRTFDAPVALQSAGAPGDRGWPALALDARADVHAVWLDHRGLVPPAGAAHADHQRRGAGHDGVAMARKSALYYASTAGAGPSPERQLANGVCYCCKTALAAGPDGSLYAAWRSVYPGNLRDMAFTMSRDGARSFLPPVRVSEDGWAINGCPDDGPSIALDRTGGVHLVWPTVVNGPQPEGALFYATTSDGAHFSPRVRIPTLGGRKPAHPQIVIDGGGRTFVAWDENVYGRQVAAMREIRVSPAGSPSFGDIVTLSSGDSGTYPVIAPTDAGVFAVWTSGGSPSRVEARLVRIP